MHAMSEIRYATKFWWQCRRHYKLRAVWFIKSVELIGGKVIRGQTSLCTHGTLSRGPTAGAIDIWQIATVVQSIPFHANAKWIIAFAFWADANLPLIDLVELRAISERY
jgi:hypothetical protein